MRVSDRSWYVIPELWPTVENFSFCNLFIDRDSKVIILQGAPGLVMMDITDIVKQIYHSYYKEKSRVDKLACFTIAWKSLAVFVYYFLRTCQTKFFKVNSEYIKPINKFWGKIYSENCQLFEFIYRFQFAFMYLEKSTLCANQPAQYH